MTNLYMHPGVSNERLIDEGRQGFFYHSSILTHDYIHGYDTRFRNYARLTARFSTLPSAVKLSRFPDGRVSPFEIRIPLRERVPRGKEGREEGE